MYASLVRENLVGLAAGSCESIDAETLLHMLRTLYGRISRHGLEGLAPSQDEIRGRASVAALPPPPPPPPAVCPTMHFQLGFCWLCPASTSSCPGTRYAGDPAG